MVVGTLIGNGSQPIANWPLSERFSEHYPASNDADDETEEESEDSPTKNPPKLRISLAEPKISLTELKNRSGSNSNVKVQ